MVPHGIANDGDEPLKVVGFFCDKDVAFLTWTGTHRGEVEFQTPR